MSARGLDIIYSISASLCWSISYYVNHFRSYLWKIVKEVVLVKIKKAVFLFPFCLAVFRFYCLQQKHILSHRKRTFSLLTETCDLSPQISAKKADPNLGFVIQTCFVSSDSSPDVASDYVVIENICPKDDSVHYYPQRGEFPIPHIQMDKKRFSFTYRSKFSVSLLFLHCEMSLCSRRNEKEMNLPEVETII